MLLRSSRLIPLARGKLNYRSFPRGFATLFPSEQPQFHAPYSRWGIVIIVQQQTAVVIERFGKLHKVLTPGFHFVIPFVDRVAYSHNLKELAIPVPNQAAITNDNVSLNVDGVLYVKIVNAMKASYGTDNLQFSITQLAQTTMRSELGKITLDKTFAERETLNAQIVEQINKASDAWGISCLRYEIRDISPPQSVKNAMDMQAEAERKKRAAILQSEGERESKINLAQAARQAAILQAKGEARSIIVRARATSKGIRAVAQALQRAGGQEAVSVTIAEKYVNAWGKVAKEGTTVILPSDPGNPSNFVASALAIYQNIVKKETFDALKASPIPADKEPEKVEDGDDDEDDDEDDEDSDDLLFDEADKNKKSTKKDADKDKEQTKIIE